MSKLTNKVALVTGAGSGIGKASAKRLAKEGAAVAVSDLFIDSAKQAAQEIIEEGGKAFAYSMDVANEDSVIECFRNALKDLGRLDILHANAGIQVVHPFDEFPLEDWKKVVNIMGDGAFLTAREAFRIMKKSGNGGKIIFTGSVHSHLASIFKAPYCFTKHGQLGLCRVIAKEGVEYKIHSYVVCPGFVRTPLVDKQIPEQAKLKGITEEEVIKNILLKDTIDGEFTTTDEISDLIILFASDTNGSLSGQSLLVTHGWGMH